MQELSVLESQIRECFGRVLYTHKTHEKMAEGCAGQLRHYKLAQIVLSAVTASGVFAAFAFNGLRMKVLNAILSLLTLWVSGLMKNTDPGGSAQKHRDAASAIWPIRESYLSLLTDLRAGAVDADQVRKRRDELQGKLASVLKSAPQTNSKAYAAAQKALKVNEEFTFTDEEIDKFLPQPLKRGKNA